MLKASWGGGGRGMRVVESDAQLAELLPVSRREAKAAFGNDEVYLEKLVRRARHVEVQILGDTSRRAGSPLRARLHGAASQPESGGARARGVPDATRSAPQLCEPALEIGRAVQYLNAGTVEFLQDADTGEFYFIEVNPRIQVEHTVTECATGIDLVKAQIRIAGGARIGTPESGVPPQGEIRISAHALQCRVTTEDPENNFIPDYGAITAYRSPAGFGIRLDAGTAYCGAIITRSYDSLLVKVTAWSPTPEETIARMHRALWEFRIRGVVTNLRFCDQVITHPRFAQRRLHHAVHRRDAGAVPLAAPRDRATRMLTFIGDVIVNGKPGGEEPRAAGAASRSRACRSVPLPSAATARHEAEARRARSRALREVDARGEARAAHRHDDARCAPVAAGHAHAHARSDGHRAALREPAAAAVLDGVLGRRDVRRRHALPEGGSVAAPRRSCASAMPNLLLQMLLRSANAVGYTNYPDNVVRFFVKQRRGARHRRVPHLRLAQLGGEHARRDRRGAARPGGCARRPSATPAI